MISQTTHMILLGVDTVVPGAIVQFAKYITHWTETRHLDTGHVDVVRALYGAHGQMIP